MDSFRCQPTKYHTKKMLRTGNQSTLSRALASAGPECPGPTIHRVDRTTTLPVQTALATSWYPFRSRRRHRRLWFRFRSWGLGPAACFRCHRHRICCPFTSSSARSSTPPPQLPRAARRDRSRPEPLSDPHVPYRFTSLPMDLTQPIAKTPHRDEPVNSIYKHRNQTFTARS